MGNEGCLPICGPQRGGRDTRTHTVRHFLQQMYITHVSFGMIDHCVYATSNGPPTSLELLLLCVCVCEESGETRWSVLMAKIKKETKKL
jgi:hypothetical protein